MLAQQRAAVPLKGTLSLGASGAKSWRSSHRDVSSLVGKSRGLSWGTELCQRQGAGPECWAGGGSPPDSLCRRARSAPAGSGESGVERNQGSVTATRHGTTFPSTTVVPRGYHGAEKFLPRSDTVTAVTATSSLLTCLWRCWGTRTRRAASRTNHVQCARPDNDRARLRGCRSRLYLTVLFVVILFL